MGVIGAGRPIKSGFRRRVPGEAGHGAPGHGGGDVDDHASVAGTHVWGGELDEAKWAEKVGLEQSVYLSCAG